MKIDLKNEPFNLIGATDFVIEDWTIEPDQSEPPMWQAPLHRHHGCDEAWYVLEGSLGFLVDSQTVDAGPGDLVYVKKGQSHTFWNSSKTPTRFLIFMTAKTQDLISAIHASSDRSPESLKKLFASFEAELL